MGAIFSSSSSSPLIPPLSFFLPSGSFGKMIGSLSPLLGFAASELAPRVPWGRFPRQRPASSWKKNKGWIFRGEIQEHCRPLRRHLISVLCSPFHRSFRPYRFLLILWSEVDGQNTKLPFGRHNSCMTFLYCFWEWLFEMMLPTSASKSASTVTLWIPPFLLALNFRLW